MTKMIIDWTDDSQVGKYLFELSKSKNPMRHANYDATVKTAKELSVHVYGNSPGELLNDYRPNEPQDVHDYRLKIWQPITKSKSEKVINVLGRIQNPKNYSILFPDMPEKVGKEETLKIYTEENYPFYGNLLQWAFDVALKSSIADPNAWVVVMPSYYEEGQDNEYIRPYCQIVPSCRVIDYDLDNYLTVLSEEKSKISTGSQKKEEGLIYYIYTIDSIYEARQVGEKKDMKFDFTQVAFHDIGSVPAFVMGGTFVPNSYPFLYESFIEGVMPFWNDAVRCFSDLQANFVQHIYLERAELQIECDGDGCTKGKISVPKDDGKWEMKTCTRCHGTGFISGRSPYGVIVRKDKGIEGTDTQNNFPGVEYISKPTEVVVLLKDHIADLIRQGFAAINMDFLSDMPLAESGAAKEVDRTELNSFIQIVSDNLFSNILKWSYYFIAHYRYHYLLGHEETNKILPVIMRPVSFDVMTASMLTQEIASAKTAGLSSDVMASIEADFIDKRFSTDNNLRLLYKLMRDLDPLSGKSEDEKMSVLANGGTMKVNYVISSNIRAFIKRALDEKKEFVSMKMADQLAILKEYASEIIAERQPAIPKVMDDGTVIE